jgi:hypothetical protein
VDDVGIRRDADFSKLLVMQYGTATIYRGTDEVFIDNTTERDPYKATSAVTRIKVNPYTKLSINGQVWLNSSTTEVRVVDVNLPVGNYAVFAIGYDGDASVADEMCVPGTLVVETPRDSRYSIAIGGNRAGAAAEDARIDDALVNDAARAIYGHASLRVPTVDIATMRVGPLTTVVVSRRAPRETQAEDVLCAWANKANTEMVITTVKEVLEALPNRGPSVVYLNVSAMSNTPYTYASYVRLMFQDKTPRSLAVAELVVRYSGYYIEGGVVKFERAQHNRAAVASARASSGDARAVVDKSVASEFESSTEVMPWVEVCVGGPSSNKYIDHVHVIFSGDATKRARLRGASIGIFDGWHYLVDSTPVWSETDGNDVVANTRELDYPRYKGLRFNLMYLQVDASAPGAKRSDLIAWIQVENVQGSGFNCFTKPAISLVAEQRLDIMRATPSTTAETIPLVSTGNYYAEVPDYLGMPIMYRFIKLWTRGPLGRSKIDLYMYTQKTNPNGFYNASSGVRGPTYLSVFKKSVALPPAVDGMLFGTTYNYYCVDLYAT